MPGRADPNRLTRPTDYGRDQLDGGSLDQTTRVSSAKAAGFASLPAPPENTVLTTSASNAPDLPTVDLLGPPALHRPDPRERLSALGWHLDVAAGRVTVRRGALRRRPRGRR
jgi:hypothetical protein